jgi:threonine/homoserine/homoserine lactone efflux protein
MELVPYSWVPGLLFWLGVAALIWLAFQTRRR